jgi:hypothetical protein
MYLRSTATSKLPTDNLADAPPSEYIFRVGLYEFFVALPNNATLSISTEDGMVGVGEVFGDGETEAIEGVEGINGGVGIVGDGNNLFATGLTFIGISKLPCFSLAGSGSGKGRK